MHQPLSVVPAPLPAPAPQAAAPAANRPLVAAVIVAIMSTGAVVSALWYQASRRAPRPVAVAPAPTPVPVRVAPPAPAPAPEPEAATATAAGPSRAPVVEAGGVRFQVLAIDRPQAEGGAAPRVWIRHLGQNRIAGFATGQRIFDSELALAGVEAGTVVFTRGTERLRVRLEKP